MLFCAYGSKQCRSADKFVCDLHQEAMKLFNKYIATPKPMILTAAELRSPYMHKTAGGDHCHIVGSYRGAAHNECNLMHRYPKLPVVIHNLKGYDRHLIA